MIEKAKRFAFTAHESTNEFYDGQPYSIHISEAVEFGKEFLHLIPTDEAKQQILAAIYLHDTIEGCRISYNDIRKEFGKEVAEMVLAVTPLRGRNRKEKQGPEYYQGVKETPGALFVKLSDRLANVDYSRRKANRYKFNMYLLEYPLLKALETPELSPMFKRLENLLMRPPVH